MKKMLITWSVIISISCNVASDKNPEKITQQLPNDSLPLSNKTMDTLKTVALTDTSINLKDKNSIHLSFADGTDSITATGQLDRLHATVRCIFSITEKKQLTATIETTKRSANIRFNQIILPGKKADGPFGKELLYDLPQKGIYTLIIGHSMMAENPYIGSFRLHVSLH